MDILKRIKFLFPEHYRRLRKTKVKKLLLKKWWEVQDDFLFNYIYESLGGRLPTLDDYIRNELNVKKDCFFDVTIWHQKPCMGELGPNPGEGIPVAFGNLKGNEYLTLELHEKPYSALSPSLICTLYLNPGKFSFLKSENQYLLEFDFRFTIEKLPRDGKARLVFDHENQSKGKCTLIYI